MSEGGLHEDGNKSSAMPMSAAHNNIDTQNESMLMAEAHELISPNLQ